LNINLAENSESFFFQSGFELRDGIVES
jgi:hypothetical protein